MSVRVGLPQPLSQGPVIFIHMEYTFTAYKELARPDGFGYPVDVKYGTIYLGTLVAQPDGFLIYQVDTPQGKKIVDYGSKPRTFKTQNDAAVILRRLWVKRRQENS